MSSWIIGKLPAKRHRGAAADNEKLASMIAHVPRTGSVNFRVHAADAVKAVRHPQMAHGLSRERARCGALQDDASHRVSVMVLRVLGRLAGEQDCVCGWIDWCLSARCRCAEKNNHAAEPHDRKRILRTKALCVFSRGGC